MKACVYCHGKIRGHGRYWVRHRRIFVERYRCTRCLRTQSGQSLSATKYQKKSHLNEKIKRELCNGVSERAIGRTLGISRHTVHRKFLFLSDQVRKTPPKTHLSKILYFDEMESIEHTKLKPLTIALAITDEYKIVAAEVGTLAAKGHLALISRRKYGPREDQSALVCERAMKKAKERIIGSFHIRTDEKTSYTGLIRRHFKGMPHLTYKSPANEEPHLKYNKKRFDPMFPVNQRIAKLRSDLKRLTRRSWCTTKKIENLQRHLDLYCAYNNA